MLGVTWDHRATADAVVVEVRSRRSGAWTPWTELDTDLDGGPLTTAADSEFRDGTEPVWVGNATGVEVAVYGRHRAPRGLEVSAIDPGTTSSASNLATTVSPPALVNKGGAYPEAPQIITRAEWGADARLGDKCWDPRFGTTFKAVIIHHTAGSNSYTKAESAALVRGVYAYHTQSRGWCDIGYNFLVDRYGSVYEGRAGGVSRSVRGAHSGDYNVDTTGISLLGNFDITRPTRAMRHALVKLVSWRLGTAYHGAYGRPYLTDGRFSRISGHRDVMSTACPGRYIYRWLPRLRELVSRRLGGYESKIEAAWRGPEGKLDALGAVRVGETRDNAGRHTTFQEGRMFLSDSGLFTFYAGPVLRRYVRSGETDGDLGYPRSHVWNIRGGKGQAAEFDGGRIYWSEATRAQVLRRGTILKRYIKVGSALGPLGFPTTGVKDLRHGTRVRFVHGTITHNTSTHKTRVTHQ